MPQKSNELGRARKILPASSLGLPGQPQTLPPTGDPGHGLGASVVAPGTCTDPQHDSRKDDQLKSLGHFADSHQDGRDDGEDVVD